MIKKEKNVARGCWKKEKSWLADSIYLIREGFDPGKEECDTLKCELTLI